MNDLFDEYTDLLGAYALDAVDPAEREAIELHLLSCPRCRAEVAEHREVASFLSNTGGAAPDGVWDRIASELSPPAPPMRLAPVAPASPAPAAPTTSLDEARRARRGTRTALAVLAVAACIVAVLGFIAVGQSNRLDTLESALRDQSIERQANDAVANAELTVRMDGEAGSGEAVVAPSGQGYLILDGVAAPADGDVYQLWGKVDETILSLGTFGEASRTDDGRTIVPFTVDPSRLDDLELFAVTQERAPGVVASEQPAILAGTV
ncbi:MAG: anti-sigma factor [Acidimicrobiales bacterium]